MSQESGIDTVTRRNVNTISKLEAAEHRNATLGERLADNLAASVGSWSFLIVQSVLLLSWMVLNVVGWWSHWDPYPFILLNLVLSFQAAFATPVILMSQNRQARLTERRNRLDLQINLLDEQESTEELRLLRLLCEKLEIHIEEPEEQALEQATKPDEIIKQIVQATEGGKAR